MYFCEGMDNSPAMIRLHTKHAQMSSESLADIFKIRDSELVAQAAIWTAAGSVVLRLDDTTNLYIRTACETIDKAKLQLIPAYGQPPEFSEGLHEKLSILTQAIYFENFFFLTCGGARPTMSARIEAEFRHQLRVRRAASLLTLHIHRSLIGSISGIV